VAVFSILLVAIQRGCPRRVRPLTVAAAALFAVVSVCNLASAATQKPLYGATRYGQSNWEVVPVPVAASGDLVVSCLNDTTCVAVGDGRNNGSQFIKSTDGGVTWSSDSSYTYGVGDLSCIPSGFCMAVPYGGDPHLIVSTDAGGEWVPISPPPFQPSNLHPISATCNTQFCIVTGGDGNGNIPVHGNAAFLTSDQGQTWSSISLPAPMKDLQAMSCNPTGQCYLVYDTYTNQFSDIAISKDRGHSWSPVPKANGFTSLNGFSCPSHGSCVYLATQILEVSAGNPLNWFNEYGPFERKQNRSVSAFALSCVSLNQCLIGGGIGNQSVVWIEGSAWSSHRVVGALQSAVPKLDLAFEVGVEQVRQAVGTAQSSALVSLEKTMEDNSATIARISLHARGNERVLAEAIGAGWNGLVGSVNQIAQNGDPNGTASSTLKSDLQRLLAAQRKAGTTGSLNPGSFTITGV
jgi:hypothetical protein